MCDGMLSWAEFRLAEGVRIETRNRYYGTNWANWVLLMNRCLVNRGQSCTTHFKYNDDRLSWVVNWSIQPV